MFPSDTESHMNNSYLCKSNEDKTEKKKNPESRRLLVFIKTYDLHNLNGGVIFITHNPNVTVELPSWSSQVDSREKY